MGDGLLPGYGYLRSHGRSRLCEQMGLGRGFPVMTSWIRRVAVLLRSRAWQLGVAGYFCLLGVLLCGVSWRLTAPLEKTGVGSTALPPNTVTAAPAASGEHTGTPAGASPAQHWAIEPASRPETRLEGQPTRRNCS